MHHFVSMTYIIPTKVEKMKEDYEMIEMATKNLHRGIEKLLQKAVKDRKPPLDDDTVLSRIEKKASKLVQHIRHLLRQLLERRQSLKALIEWLQREWKTKLKQNLQNHPQEVLTHAFQCLIRCQDGITLLTSGECRHPVDIQEATTTTKNKFPSYLRTLKERSDGYTKLYSGDAYSGYGFDEYSNETVGIQVRLVELLRPYHKRPWEYLESSCELLESLLDQHENVIKALKQTIQEIKEEMRIDITQQLAKPVIFSTQDKMERLQVLIPARRGPTAAGGGGGRKEQKISITRLGNNFQIFGVSVLPNDYHTIQHWDRVLSLNLPKDENNGKGGSTNSEVVGKKWKRPVVLEDSDSSDDERVFEQSPSKGNTDKTSSKTSSFAQQSTTGLAVRVETTKTTRIETEISLNSIKEQMGVDRRGLEASRQDLELENHGIGRDVGPSSMCSEEEEQVQRLTRNLKNVEQRTGIDYDTNEVWDAREELRRAYMELGIWALESSKNRNLQQALSSFEQAKQLTMVLQDTHEKEVVKVNDQTDRARQISRRLLFLLSEARTNIGIVLMEMAESHQSSVNQRMLGKAIRDFQQTRGLLAQLRGLINVELGRCPAHSNTWITLKSDSFECDILDSMVCRCHGKAIWLSRKDDGFVSAEKVFEQGWSFFRGFNVACLSHLLPGLLGTVVACIESCSTLANIGCEELETMKQQQRISDEGKCTSNIMLQLVCKALSKQTEILREVERLRELDDSNIREMVKSFERGHSLPSSFTSQKSLENVKSWWQKCLEQPNALEDERSMLPLPHSALSSLGTMGRSVPTSGSGEILPRHFQQRLDSSSNPTASRWKQSHGSGPQPSRDEDDMNTSNGWNPSFEDVAASAPYRRPTRFRKWGDELLLSPINDSISTNQKTDLDDLDDNEKDSSLRCALSYPTIPPPMPPELLRLYDPVTYRKSQDIA